MSNRQYNVLPDNSPSPVQLVKITQSMPSIPAKLIAAALMVLSLEACDAGEAAAAEPPETIRVATFNIAMGLEEQGAMAAALHSGNDARLQALARVLNTVRPDIVLLAEFDYDPSVDAAGLLHANYLASSETNADPIAYPHHYRPPVNTGVDSGLDLDRNGETGDPADAWGFGFFPGQYGMLVLSRFPIDKEQVRTFQALLWKDLADAQRPMNEDGSPFYPDETWAQLRLSSKSHADVPIVIGEETLHLLVSHPTPPVFDGPEDRNGARNHDELALWNHYISGHMDSWLVDDQGRTGGLSTGARFVIAGDLNADPHDGDAHPNAINQLLQHPAVDAECIPSSEGAVEAATAQGGKNEQHAGDPAHDTSDFNDEFVGNYRLDYVIPSATLSVTGCGVHWPLSSSPLHADATFSDHRLVWVDLAW